MPPGEGQGESGGVRLPNDVAKHTKPCEGLLSVKRPGVKPPVPFIIVCGKHESVSFGKDLLCPVLGTSVFELRKGSTPVTVAAVTQILSPWPQGKLS